MDNNCCDRSCLLYFNVYFPVCCHGHYRL